MVNTGEIAKIEEIVMKIKPTEPKRRIVWGFNPASRTLPSKKIYNRSKGKQLIQKEFNNG